MKWDEGQQRFLDVLMRGIIGTDPPGAGMRGAGRATSQRAGMRSGAPPGAGMRGGGGGGAGMRRNPPKGPGAQDAPKQQRDPPDWRCARTLVCERAIKGTIISGCIAECPGCHQPKRRAGTRGHTVGRA